VGIQPRPDENERQIEMSEQKLKLEPDLESQGPQSHEATPEELQAITAACEARMQSGQTADAVVLVEVNW
jgi:hypothetical protein